MAVERTLSMIKPDAVAAKKAGAILSRLEAKFKILTLRHLTLSREQAQAFYAVHEGRPFYNDLVTFMTSGPIIAIAMEGEGAIAAYRELMGATDSRKAAPGTLRGDFGTDNQKNACHGSDSVENGLREIAFFFPELK